jgi:murein DD-endopeptidase MepM/ murein hydrolase activator NlpD
VQSEDSPSQLTVLKHLFSAYRQWLFAGTSALIIGLLLTVFSQPRHRQAAALLFAEPALSALPIQSAQAQWSFATHNFDFSAVTLERGDILGNILLKHGLDYAAIGKLVENTRNVFSISSMRTGKELHFIAPKGGSKPQFMVYEPSPYEYVVFGLQEPYKVEIIKRAVETKIVSASGVLESSFWQALTDNGLNDELADGMIDVLGFYVDFHHQKQGDRFKVVYEQHIVEGKAVGSGNILAALYEREGKLFHAFRYDRPNERTTYYDMEGRPAKRAFLKSPLKFTRISSRFSLNRLHPILGYFRPHFGTDYAAPYGTPIMSVADGTVQEATRRGGNGNFVKIRHDNRYESQYLHMQGFAKGIRPGTHVQQGQVIGYVGSTGLATGPHVCFRFWRNGQQVDHLRLDLPTAEPMKGADFQQFVVRRDELVKQLETVPYRTQAEIQAARTTTEKTKGYKP